MDLQPNQQPTVGYILSAWPRLSETFILNEVVAVERLGCRLRIFSIKNPKTLSATAELYFKQCAIAAAFSSGAFSRRAI